jgi:dihydrofolate reductase
MRKVVAITYVTLDGVLQCPGAPEEDPRNGFTYGGWMFPYWYETLGKFLERNVTGSFDLLLGRRTYEMLAAHWPYAGDNPVTERYNKATKFVVTRSLGTYYGDKRNRGLDLVFAQHGTYDVRAWSATSNDELERFANAIRTAYVSRIRHLGNRKFGAGIR